MNFLILPVANGRVQLGALTLASPKGSDGQIVLGVRPEDLQPAHAAEGFPFTLRVAEPLGPHITLTGEALGQQIRVVVPQETPLRLGATLHLRPRNDRIVWMNPTTGAAIGWGGVGQLGTEAAGD
jgi:multiple sugar transport system ATP-binding protein